jgi:hypothetical protein
MADRYSERRPRWEDEERRHPYDSRYRERDWGYGGRDRAFFERFVDELRSWFGDEAAQRRRMADERDEMRHRGEWDERDWGRGRSDWGTRSDWAREPNDREWSRQWGYVEGRGPGSGDRPREWGRPMSSDFGYAGSSGYGAWGRERDWNREPPWGGQGSGGFGTYGFSHEGRADSARYSGVSSSRERDWASGPHYGRGPRNYQRTDERIREDVCERLAQHSYLDASDIEVVVLNADVTLQGSVNDRWAKRTAEEIAEGVWGVKQVHNQLRLSQGTVGQDRPSSQEGQGRSTGQQRSHWAA